MVGSIVIGQRNKRTAIRLTPHLLFFLLPGSFPVPLLALSLSTRLPSLLAFPFISPSLSPQPLRLLPWQPRRRLADPQEQRRLAILVSEEP